MAAANPSSQHQDGARGHLHEPSNQGGWGFKLFPASGVVKACKLTAQGMQACS